MPLWLAGALIIIVPTLVAMAGTVFVRNRVGLASLRWNNEVAGFKFATIGVLYAVLLAFAVFVSGHGSARSRTIRHARRAPRRRSIA